MGGVVRQEGAGRRWCNPEDLQHSQASTGSPRLRGSAFLPHLSSGLEIASPPHRLPPIPAQGGAGGLPARGRCTQAQRAPGSLEVERREANGGLLALGFGAKLQPRVSNLKTCRGRSAHSGCTPRGPWGPGRPGPGPPEKRRCGASSCTVDPRSPAHRCQGSLSCPFSQPPLHSPTLPPREGFHSPLTRLTHLLKPPLPECSRKEHLVLNSI